MSLRTTVALLAILAVSSAVAPIASATPPIFDDDFQTGIDAARWTLHNPGGGTWIPATEGGNGYVTSPAQSVLYSGDREDNMRTTRMDFADFEMTWQWRFRSDGWHAARRDVYFRCDDAFSPNGYWLHVAINDPPQAHPTAIYFARLGAPGNQALWTSTIVDYPWQMNRWYSFRLRVSGNSFKVKAWLLGDPEPAAWMLEDTDPGNGPTQGRIGLGDYWQGVTDADNVVVSSIGADVPTLPLRNPQISLNGSELQQYLNGMGESISVYTDQLAAQVWTSSVSGNATFTLMVELAGNAAGNSIGVYNALDPPNPPLFQIFPGAAQAGWFATCHFGPGGSLAVLLYDQNAVFQGQTNYASVNRNNFGFYLQGPGGTFYSQDSRNGGNAQILTYLGTGQNFGDWWECFEDLPWIGGDRDFNDAVLLLQSVAPTPARRATWGALKALYR